ncbi:MAG TPA: hypothetical protein PLM33_14250, partial [Acidobacteriota bacterium]|nr:hypothetical protein [Acidobacteriota bacterium]
VARAWEAGDGTSPAQTGRLQPRSLMLLVGAGTSRPRKFWVARAGRRDVASPGNGLGVETLPPQQGLPVSGAWEVGGRGSH